MKNCSELRETYNMKRYLIIAALVSVFSALSADVDIKSGTLRLVIEDYDGTVFLYRQNEQGSYVSLLDSKRYSVNSGLYVLYGKNVQKLSRSGGIRIASSATEDGARLTFSLKDKFECTVLFTFMASDGKENDSIRVDISLSNESGKRQLEGVRLFLDTWLGENSGRHFSTALHDSLAVEYFFTDMSREKWIQSSNGEVAMRLLLSGSGITKVQTLAVANKDVLGVPVWAPRFVPERKFDSIQSYNNSALSVAWEPVYLEPQAKTDICFFITTGSSRTLPANLKELRNKTGGTSYAGRFALDPSLSIYDTLVPYKNAAAESDDEYIRSLIERVRELEADPDSMNREEILKLNAEIDAVLLKSGR